MESLINLNEIDTLLGDIKIHMYQIKYIKMEDNDDEMTD